MLRQEIPARAPEVAWVRLVRHDLIPQNAEAETGRVLTFPEGDDAVGVPAAADLNGGEGQDASERHADNEYRERAHDAAIVARWRTLRCQECRRPLQRALLMPRSATLATCRRDRATFVFTVAEGGALLVVQRG